MPALKIAVIALSLALDVFAVSIGVGMRGVAPAVKWRIGVAFALAEISMNIIGALLGVAAGRLIGAVAGYLGFIALIGVGLYMIYESRRADAEGSTLDMTRGYGLFIASLSISLDSLGIGFSILYVGVPVYASLATIGVTSIAATSLGIGLGRMLGRRAEENAELIGGIVLAATGAVFLLQKIFGWG